jgi:predicted transcriptional regulator of viral defense system
MEEQRSRTDYQGLEAMALSQGGYFDRADAQAHSIGDRLLHYYVQIGRFERVFPGVYRMVVAPISPHDDLLQAWVWSNYRGAISHSSALALYGLSDVMPGRVEIVVPHGFRRQTGHFQVYHSDLMEDEVRLYEGICVTTPARSIVDAAAAGTGPEQIHLAVSQAVERGLANPAQLREAAKRPHYRNRRAVVPLIERALVDACP